MPKGGDSSSGDYSESSIRAHFEEHAELVTSIDNHRLKWWQVVLLLAVVFAFSVYEVSDPFDSSVSMMRTLLAGTVNLLGILVIHWLVRRWKPHYQLRIRQQLAQSNLAQRLANAEFVEDSIFAHTPWPWRLKLKGKQHRSLKSTHGRICNNLDWYLKPGRIYLPAISRVGLLMIPLLVVMVAMQLLGIWLAWTVFVLGVLAIGDFGVARFLVWWREANAYFCEYFLDR